MGCYAYNNVARLLKAIAHPCRLRMLMALRNRSLSVSEIQSHLQLKQSLTSQYLTKLRDAGVIRAERDGTTVRYSIANEEVFEILVCVRRCMKKTEEAYGNDR